MIDGVLPDLTAHLLLSHFVEFTPVKIPGYLLVRLVAPINDYAVNMVSALASRTRLQAAGQPCMFMTGAEGSVGIRRSEVSAMQGRGKHIERIDILHRIDLAVLGPGSWPKKPKSRPVTEAVGGRGLLDRCGHFKFPTR